MTADRRGRPLMAGPGVVIDETLSCGALPPAAATARLVAAAGSDYRVVDMGAGRINLVRGVRPTWALVLGIVLAPTLIGLLFLLVRTSESFTATVQDDHRGATVRLEGTISSHALRAVRATFAPPPAPVLGAPPPPPVPGDADVPPTLPGAAPTTPVPGTPAPPIGVLLRFDDGGVITAGPAMFIGRDPIAPPGEAPALLVPVSDPERSVSKTHLTVRAHPDGVVITDRGSVNGTVIDGPGGLTASLPAGQATFVPLGSTVRFGNRSFLVSGGVV